MIVFHRLPLMLRFTLAVIIIVLYGAGCAMPGGGLFQPLTARTKVHYTTPDGRDITYDSDRDYQDLKLRYVLDPDTSKVKELELTVGNAGSPSGLAAAALQQNLKLMDVIEKLTAGLAKGATAGS